MRTALEFFVPFAIRCGILQQLVFRTDHAVILLIINILIRPKIAIFAHRALVREDGDTLALDDFSCDRGGLIACIHHNILDLWKFLDQTVVVQLKCHAVMDISGRHFKFQDIALFVTSRVRFVGELLLVLALVENAAVRIRCGLVHDLCLRRIVVIIRKRLLSVRNTILVDLLHELLLVLLRSDRHLLFDAFLHVCARLDMRPVDENGFRREHTTRSDLIEDPVKHVLDGLLCEAMLEIIADRGKMRDLLRHRIAQEPTVCHVHMDLLDCPTQRRDTVKMLDDDHFEQHHGVAARSSVVRTIQILHQIIDPTEVYRLVDLAQQMILRDELVHTEEFHLAPVLIFLFQHRLHRLYLYYTAFI